MRGLEQRRALAELIQGNRPAIAIDDAIVDAAVHEEVAPLLGARVAAGEITADAKARDALVRAYRACLVRNLLVENDLRPLIAALRQHAIPALLLKGAALLRICYRDPGCRSMSDVDVLVPQVRWRDAITIARQLGWTAWSDDRRPVTSRLDYVRALSLRGKITVEIHRYFCARSQFDIDYEPIFARAREDEDGASLPDPIDLFVSLAIHAAKHAFLIPLRSYVDGFALISNGLVGQKPVIARAQSWSACRATATWIRVLVALGLAEPSWTHVARILEPDDALARVCLSDTAMGTHGWRYQQQILRLIDRPSRQLLWLGERMAYRMADLALAPCMTRQASA